MGFMIRPAEQAVSVTPLYLHLIRGYSIINRQQTYRPLSLGHTKVCKYQVARLASVLRDICKIQANLFVLDMAKFRQTQKGKKRGNKAMNRGLTFAAGLGVGSGLIYVLDPQLGKRRRALLRDKLLWLQRKSGNCVDVTARDLSNRASGIAANIQSRFTSEEVNDDIVVERVRANLGRIVSHPSAIEVMSQGGNVTLSGPILEEEVTDLLSCVKRIPGVKEVNNKLEVHEEAGNHPALQGGRERQGHQFEFLQENWSPAARLVAGLAGVSLAVYGGTRRDALGAGLGAAGVLLVTRGITNVDFSRLAGLGEREKTDDQRTLSVAPGGSNPESPLIQTAAAI
jgi:hypothetical protein